MDQLDAEAEARATVEMPVTPGEVAHALSSMRRVFAKAEPSTQQRIAQALFGRVEVLGPLLVWCTRARQRPKDRPAPCTASSRREVRSLGRGERDSPLLTQVRHRPPFVLKNRTLTASRPRLAMPRSA